MIENLPEILELHKKWLADKSDGKRADLSGAYLPGAYLSRANLSGAYLDACEMNWSCHTLISERLWQAANTDEQRMLAAFVGRMTDWCWEEWIDFEHPAKMWALTQCASWQTDRHSLPEIVSDYLAQKQENKP